MSPEIQHAGPSKPIRASLRCVEVPSWLMGILCLIAAVGIPVDGARGNVSLTAQLTDASQFQRSSAQVDGGYIDVTLKNVPLESSWAYILVLVLVSLMFATTFILVARLTKGVRHGAPFDAVSPRVLYVFAALWTALSIAAVAVLAATQHRIAESVGASIPGASFVYSPSALDIGAIALGPVVAIVIAIFASGSKMWSEHRVMV